MTRLIVVLMLLSVIWITPAQAGQSPFATPDDHEVQAVMEKTASAASSGEGTSSGGSGSGIRAAELVEENALPPVPPAPPAPVLVPSDEEESSPAGGAISGGTASSGSSTLDANTGDESYTDSPTSTDSSRSKPLTIEGKKFLPLRVLSRAFSNIYQNPDKMSPTVEENVPAFQSFYVYDKKASPSDLNPLGWYQVGTDNRGTVVGWMNSGDVFEWKQTMSLSYTHPEGRHPVLMFEKKQEVEKYATMDPVQRKQAVEKVYADIDSGRITKDFPVVTVEPKMAVDITKQFYLLPILSFEKIQIDNREGRILQLAAVTKGGATARESSDIRKNKGYLETATETTAQEAARVIKNAAIDVVWVMDTTNSMMPYITQTLKVVENASKRITGNPDVARSVKFGIWGYRDSLEIPGIGYNVKNYTPKLEQIDAFNTILHTVDITKVGSEGYAEDVFSGVNSAITETAWTPNAIRFVILVGDAPSHEPGHKWNASGQSSETLRKLADEKNISLIAIHIKDPQAGNYHQLTQEQFTTLSKNKGVLESSYYSTPSEDLAGFEQATKDMINVIIASLEQSKAQVSSPAVPASDFTTTTATTAGPATAKPANLDLSDNQTAPANGAPAGAASLASGALHAAFVQWIGSQAGAQAPRDVVAWVMDKDLLATDIQALEVRLLINKRQLDSLRETLITILKAGRIGQISGDDFFSSLQAAAASTARDPDMIKRANSLAQTGLIPEFLQGLPYSSRIMDMNNELWASWSVDAQDMLLDDLEARIMAYETIHDAPEGWVQLNKNDDPGDYVYPIPLDLLP